MPNPKRRHSKTRGAKRRTHYVAVASQGARCSNCGASRMPHHVCGECGQYKGRQVLAIKAAKAD